jgi:hypothetical protein
MVWMLRELLVPDLSRRLRDQEYLVIFSDRKVLPFFVGIWGQCSKQVPALRDYADQELAGQILELKIVLALRE